LRKIEFTYTGNLQHVLNFKKVWKRLNNIISNAKMFEGTKKNVGSHKCATNQDKNCRNTTFASNEQPKLNRDR